MADPRKDGLEEASGVSISTVSPTLIQTVGVAAAGRLRGVLLHLDLVNGGGSATEVTISINVTVPLVFDISVPSKTSERLDFFVEATDTPITVTAQAAAGPVFVIGYREIWT